MQVLILGGGFGGVACGLELANLLSDRLGKDIDCTLVNDHEYHTLHFALYQTATDEQPGRSVAIPLTTIFEGRKVAIRVGKVVKIEPERNRVVLQNGDELSYDYLVLALGSETEDFGISGVEKYGHPLKTLRDARSIQHQVKALFENACNDKECIYPLRVVTGGGGFTGTELAGELCKYCLTLTKRFSMATNCFEVSIIQSGNQLLSGMDQDTAAKAKTRLESLGINVVLGSRISKVEDKELVLASGEIIPFNFLVWTVGVRGNSLLKQAFQVDKAGRVQVNEHLQVKEYSNIFACGDCVYFPIDTEGHPSPGVAQVAIEQGKVIAQNVYRLSSSSVDELTTTESLVPYQYRHFGFIVPVSGEYALAVFGPVKLEGFPAFILQQLNILRYLLTVLPFPKAFRRWNTFQMELATQD